MKKWFWMTATMVLVGLVSSSCVSARAYVGGGGAIRIGPVAVTLQSYGRTLPTFYHGGNRYVLGEQGVRYAILVQNHTGERLEVLVAVDGRDVINGRPAANFHRRGYILNPHQSIRIDGFRVSTSTVAAFRFSSVGGSYAARRGGPWFEIGKIRVAIFRERQRIAYIPRPYYRRPYHHNVPPPADGSYRRPGTERGGAGSVQKAPAPSAAPRGEAPRRKSADAPQESRAPRSYGYAPRPYYPRPTPQLGTKFGEPTYSPVRYTTFHRASSSPSYNQIINYNNCSGIRSVGICTPACGCHRYPRYPQQPPYYYPRRQYSDPPADWPYR